MTALDQQPLAVMGGTFDPIHHGHLRSALELRQTLSLARVLLMPCGVPPHRGAPVASSHHRAAMVALALADEPGLVLDRRELERPGPSFTVDSLLEIRAEIGSARSLSIIVGTDALAGIDSWHRWREVPELANIIVMARPGWQMPESGQLWQWVSQYRADEHETPAVAPAGKIFIQELRQLDIAASDIRQLMASGGSPRYLLPEPVLAYIKENHLYEH